MSTDDINKSSLNQNVTAFGEIAFDAVIASDPQERVTYWNPAAERMFGWTAQEALGKTPAELFLPENTSQEHRSERQSQLERGEALRDEQSAFRKDGSSLCIQSALRAIFDAAGKLSGYLATYRDISAQAKDTLEREQKEESLRARMEEIETLLNVSPVAIFVAHDPECVHITGNPAGYRLVELPEEANISKSAPDYERPTYRTFRNGVEVPTEDLPMQKAARLGVEVNEEELELRFEDGSRKFLFAFAKPLFDTRGKSRGAIATMLDITERKRLEAETESMARFPRENPNPILRVSQEGVVLFGNRASQQLLEDWNCPIGALLPEPWRKEVVERFHLGVPGEILLERNGRIISLHIVPIVEGQYLNIYGRDITEHKRTEEALRENERQLQLFNEILELKVHEKTGEIRRLASDLVQAVQHERHRISHILHDDLQQRIYAIQMQLTFLHDGFQQENESARKEVSEIEKQLIEILQVTRHLSIDLSPPILRDEGLSHAISWLAAQMQQRYGLEIELQAEGAFAISDEALHVLLFNCVRELLFNVVKHARTNRAVVALKWVDANLLIEVRDDGQGFPEQADSGTSAGNNLQSGFGLSTIRQQLSLFGGYMEIQSEPGAGTRVILLVPVREAE